MDSQDLELGQLMFSPNTIHNYNCPKYIIALLKDIASRLDVVMQNIYQKEYDNPFYNTGNCFIGDVFEVYAYNWDEDVEQEYNFKYKDLKISWYKYLGRGCTINGEYDEKFILKMYDDCIKEINDYEKSHLGLDFL